MDGAIFTNQRAMNKKDRRLGGPGKFILDLGFICATGLPSKFHAH
jgi:hypothetical protein